MLTIAQQFASLMDQSRFDDALQLMAEDCRYHYFEGDYSGRENIINIYRQNEKKANEIFDEITYSSEVESLSDNEYKIFFHDDLRLGASSYKHTSFQILHIENGKITNIEHHEIPGEQEALRAFFGKMKTRDVSLQ